MRTYGMPYQAVMDMPMRAFWLISGFVERIRAEEGRLALELSAAGNSPEGCGELYQQLSERSPAPVKLSVEAIIAKSAEADPDGPSRLRRLAG